jgi:hypothetical protein
MCWEIVNGEIPDNICVLHRCDNPPCCNPLHLFLGTNYENIADRDQKGRTARGEKIGKLTEGAVKVIISEYAGGGITQRELSRKHGISRAQVSHIVNRRYWKALHGLGVLAIARLYPHSAYPEDV